MFGLFGNSEETQAKILFGSTEEAREAQVEIKNPFSGKVVSTYPVCTEEDAKKALTITRDAAPAAAKTPLSQRIAWLEDVASKLREYEEDFAKLIVDEVGKPMQFARVEVQRSSSSRRCFWVGFWCGRGDPELQ